MSLTEQAILDNQQITGNSDDWGVSIRLSKQDYSLTCKLTGIHTKHWHAFDSQGATVNSKRASIAINEKNIPGWFSIRDCSNNSELKDEVNLKNHIVEVPDSTTVIKKYTVDEWFPDEKLGMIVLILSDFEDECED